MPQMAPPCGRRICTPGERLLKKILAECIGVAILRPVPGYPYPTKPVFADGNERGARSQNPGVRRGPPWARGSCLLSFGICHLLFAILISPMPPKKDLFLAIDIGTGSVRAALSDLNGKIVAFHAAEHDQQVPHFGWSQQPPSDWWKGVVLCIRAVLEKTDDVASRIIAIACCGQMHGTVLLDKGGVPVVDYAPLWNDKRTRGVLDQFLEQHDQEKLLPIAGNPAATAWPGFKLLWFKQEHPDIYRQTTSVLIVKDYINFRLTGNQAIDHPEASTTYLYTIEKPTWSPSLFPSLCLDQQIL